MTLRSVLAGLGVQADEIRLLKHGGNSHWLVIAGAQRLVLRRCGADRSPDSIAWELDLTRVIAAAGWPVNAPLTEPAWIGGRLYVLFPYLGGRALRWPHDGDYRRLGRALAELHEVLEPMVGVEQRPGWRAYVDTATPAGGLPERRNMLARLAALDRDLARDIERASDAIAPRLSLLAGLPRRPIHGDFSAWNLRFRQGRLSGLFDFDLCHLDILAADLAFARRGYHDAVVEGYLARRSLSAAEVEALDALWTGALLDSVWRILERDTFNLAEFTAVRAQFGKTRPYAGAWS